MAAFLKPDNLNIVWASGGDRLYPGDTKYASGWGVEIPPRQYFNEIDYKQDQMLAHLNQRGIAEWDADTEYQAEKSYVQDSTGKIHRCVLTHSGQNPELDVTNTYWETAFLEASQVTSVSTAAQSRAMTANDVYISPLQLANAFGGTNQSLTDSGFQALPGGLIVQWGEVSIPLGSTTGVWVYPKPFPNRAFRVFATQDAQPTQNPVGAQPDTTNSTTLKTQALTRTFGSGGDNFWIMAIGF